MPHAMHTQTPSLHVVDGRGLVVRQINYHRAVVGNVAQARVQRQQYDPAARPTATWDPRLSARFEDNPATHPNLANVFSLACLPLAVDSVDAGWRVALFGEAGQPLDSWDGRGSHWQTEYDELLRPSAAHEQADGQAARTSERFSYADSSGQAAADNLCGRLIRSDDGAGSEQVQACGILGQVLRQTRRFLNDLELPDWPEDLALRDALLEPCLGATTQLTYGPTGEALSQIDALANQQKFTYGVSGQLQEIRLRPADAGEQVLLHELKYNAFAQVESQTAGNRVVSRALFDPVSGRLGELITTRANSELLQHLLYSYDPTGNVISLEDRAQPTRHFANQRIEPINRYTHDSLYQLIQATGRETAGATIRPELPELALLPLDTSQLLNYSQHYRYDEAGNLLELKHEGAQAYTRTMQIAEDSNRSLPRHEGEAPPDFAAQFDANGNLQTLTAGQPMRWDARNQLLEVNALTRVDGINDQERYAYDSSGMRLRKTATAQAKTVQHTREVRYLPGLEIRTDSATGERLEVITLQAGRSNVRHLHWAAGKPEGIADNQLRYSVDDQLGSSTLELDSEARLISHEGYYPFGSTAWWAARSAVEANYKVIRYSGKERDASGLYYYGLRYYAPWLLRWINPDPANEADGLNPYLMVMNNPVTLIDPDGGNSVVPNDAHWIWLGKPLPAKFAQNINKFVHQNPHYTTTLWVDRISWMGGYAEALENLSKRVKIMPVDNIFDGIHYKLKAAFERERSGPLKNLAAASDIGRTALISKGALYLDTDVQLPKSVPPNMNAPKGFLINMSVKGSTPNAILATSPNSEIVQKAIASIIGGYDTRSGATWSTKRQYSSWKQIQAEASHRKETIKILENRHGKSETSELVTRESQELHLLKAIPENYDRTSLRLKYTSSHTGPQMWGVRVGMSFDTPAIYALPDLGQQHEDYGFSYLTRPSKLRRASL